MRVKYFPDTDTAFIEFTDSAVYETREVSENVYIHTDEQGNLISMTLEHAKERARLTEFSYQEMTPHSV